jgi:acetyl esterase
MELDPEIRGFLHETDQMFGADYAALPLSGQRRVYADWCARYEPAPTEDIAVSEVLIPRSNGRPGTVRATLERPLTTVRQQLPSVVFFHGGGWIMGSPETHRMITAEIARRVGAAVLSVDYRLAPEHAYPAAFDDAYDAVRWATGQGAEAGIDARRLAVAGDSAGGNLAAAVALAARDRGGPRIALQAVIYPVLKAAGRAVVDHPAAGTEAGMGAYLAAYSGGRDIAREPYALPLSAGTFHGLPPAFVAAAEIDVQREDAADYAAALRGAGIAVEHRLAAGLTHSYLRCIHLSLGAYQEFEALCNALRRALTAAPAATDAA